MKTITEFTAVRLQVVAQKKKELSVPGISPEDLTKGLGEALKLEGDKLALVLNALEVLGEKFDDLKRVVVFTLSEGEKAPERAQQKGEQYYLAEYYPPLNKKGHPGERGGRDGKSGKPGKDGRGGRGGGRGDKNVRGQRGDRPSIMTRSASGGDKKPIGAAPRGPIPKGPVPKQ